MIKSIIILLNQTRKTSAEYILVLLESEQLAINNLEPVKVILLEKIATKVIYLIKILF